MLREMGVDNVEILGDSQLVIKQLVGEYRCMSIYNKNIAFVTTQSVDGEEASVTALGHQKDIRMR